MRTNGAGSMLVSVPYLCPILYCPRQCNYYLVYGMYSQLLFLADWWGASELNIFCAPGKFSCKSMRILLTHPVPSKFTAMYKNLQKGWYLHNDKNDVISREHKLWSTVLFTYKRIYFFKMYYGRLSAFFLTCLVLISGSLRAGSVL